MRTSKPISTISYNSEPYLRGKLEELRASGAVTWWAYVRHTREEDEKKDHFHVIVSPNKILDTGALGAMFKEPDPKNPEKPLGCIEWRCSKRDEWLLYSIHDPVYLASKLERREFVYGLEDVQTSDRDELEELHRVALREGKWVREHKLVNGLLDGSYTPAELITSGAVGLGQVSHLKALAQMLADPAYLQRNGRPTHTPSEEQQLAATVSAAAAAQPEHLVEHGAVVNRRQLDRQIDADQRATAEALRKNAAVNGTRARVEGQLTIEDYDLTKRGFVPLPDSTAAPFD